MERNCSLPDAIASLRECPQPHPIPCMSQAGRTVGNPPSFPGAHALAAGAPYPTVTPSSLLAWSASTASAPCPPHVCSPALHRRQSHAHSLKSRAAPWPSPPGAPARRRLIVIILLNLAAVRLSSRAARSRASGLRGRTGAGAQAGVVGRVCAAGCGVRVGVVVAVAERALLRGRRGRRGLLLLFRVQGAQLLPRRAVP